MSVHLWPDVITPAIAILGAALGVMNAWYAINDRRVQLRVTPAQSFAQNWEGASVEVVNLSSFPVTIIEIGFVLDHSRGYLPRRIPILPDQTPDGRSAPVRLDRQEAFTVHVNLAPLRGQSITSAYVRTAAGDIRRGTSPALRQIRDRIGR